ncbi:all-trans-retinol dehydrogenase [Acrasis kona]|uniref:Short-chain dehydrogenase/reductase 3 n=1 Tax=Acrasis kona TaxID=1008807 RepID=A0AAW2YUJ9_9EUKA
MSANITAILNPITDALSDRQRFIQLLQDHYCEHSSRFLLFVTTCIAVAIISYYICKEIYERINQQDLKGRLVLITGGASGIGRIMARRFIQEGARVVIWDVHQENMKITLEELGKDSTKCKGYIVDICDYAKVYAVAKQVEQDMGPVDILINNAGIVSGKKILECSEKSLIDTVNVNLVSHFWTVRAFLGGMKQRGYGHIVTVASAAGIFGMKHLSDYAASKFGCVGFGESLRFELKAEGIHDKISTTIVCPYFINTGMFDGVTSAHNLMPILEPDYVVDKIMTGIKRKYEVVIAPRMVYVGMLGKAISPVWFVDACMTFFTRDAMNGFKGRAHTKQE